MPSMRCIETGNGIEVTDNFAPRDARGFSLVETLIALFILTLGLLAVGQMLFVAVGNPALARSKSAAAIAAQNKLDFLADAYRQNPNAAFLLNGNHGPEQVQVLNPADGTPLNRFNVAWTVSTVPDPRAGKVLKAKHVRVTVTPLGTGTTVNNRMGQNKVVSVSAIFSANPT